MAPIGLVELKTGLRLHPLRLAFGRRQIGRLSVNLGSWRRPTMDAR